MKRGTRKRKPWGLFLLSGLLLSFFLSCAPTAPPLPPPSLPPPPIPPPSPPLYEEPVPSPPKPPGVFIFDLKDTVSEDKQELFVEGKVGNRGDRATKQISVAVEALDEKGRVVAQGEATPTPQALLPGGSATFVVKLPNYPTIRRFHVEAIAR